MLRHGETFSDSSGSLNTDDAFAQDGGAGVASFSAPERPALPKPERLNRNALTVVAVVMGVLVLAAVVFVQPKNATNRPQEGRSAPEAAQGTFLDQPPTGVVAGEPNMGGPTPAAFDSRAGIASAPQSQSGLGTRGGTSDDAYRGPYDGDYSSRASADAYARPYGTDGPVGASVPAIVPPRAADPRTDAYRAALEAPLVASEVVSATGSVSDAAASNAIAVADLANGIVAGGDPAAMARTLDMGVVSRRAALSRTMRSTSNGTMIRTSVEPAPGPYAIQAGTLIPAVLLTEINSDLPGEVLAQVSRDVYDSRSEETLLIPKGSRLIGKYDNQVAAGQNRLLVAWNRVIFPDGRSVSLPGLETKDRAGAGGLHDQVDQHTRRTFGTAALLSLISAGAQLSQPNGGYGAWGSYPSTGQIAAGALGQQLSEVATQLLRRNMDAQPTIRIRQGMPFNVFLNADLIFPGPYTTSYTSRAFTRPDAALR